MAEKFVIEGGKALCGKVETRGAKNAATKMMIATLLTEEPCRLENFPKLGDTQITAELLGAIGSTIAHDSIGVTLATPEVTSSRVGGLSRKNRIPILALGPLLARTGVAEVPVLGGDSIGPRPVNFHIDALSKMGVRIEISDSIYRARTDGLMGADITLPYPSVGATENIILAAVLAKGKTTIRNAALEPELIDLVKMLQNMGAIIELGGERKVAIEGVARLHGVQHTILPDRNEAVSFATAAIATGGEVLVEGAVHEHLITFLNTLSRIGASFRVEPEGIRFWRKQPLRAIEIQTDTHPGFMTDWQQPLAVLLTQASGRSVIHETVYEDRFGYAQDLIRMGADITLKNECFGDLPCRFRGKKYNHTCIINGPTVLRAMHMAMPDIRAGIANVIAALSAQGVSEITGIEHIDRGYEKIDERLRGLGARIERIEE